MRIDAFDFDLPEDRIALRPVRPRDAAKLLVVKPDQKKRFRDDTVLNLADYLDAGDLLVFNNTKVIPAELAGERHRGEAVSKVSINLHKKSDAFTWQSFARPQKRLKADDSILFKNQNGEIVLKAEVLKLAEGGEVTLRFEQTGPDFEAGLAQSGRMPLPPYIGLKRDQDEADLEDYQTVYASEAGAVAAPTAGLHFTDRIFKSLENKGIQSAYVTLHVGAGTFLPVKAEDTDNHKMHAEWGQIDEATAALINETRKQGKRIVAVGTTSLRLLESAAADDGFIKPFEGDTDIFIKPGYRFKMIDALMTNFHLPKSTLFMLVSALSGLETMKAAYKHAVENRYRFYSYGDSSLLFKANT
jgi:S-adenosylmethionine:tRNA ribosyltransferase-isomerase